MLRMGQKVQIAKEVRLYRKYDYTKGTEIAGKIAKVAGFAGSHAALSDGKIQDFYYLDISSIPVGRCALYPIDDEPCDEEFLKEFINETSTA